MKILFEKSTAFQKVLKKYINTNFSITATDIAKEERVRKWCRYSAIMKGVDLIL